MGHCQAKVRDRHCQAEKRSKRMDDSDTKQDKNGRKDSRVSRRNRCSKDGSRCQEKYQYPSRFISRSPPAAASRCITSGFGRRSKPLRDSRALESPTVLLNFREPVVKVFLVLPHVLQLQLR
jgi:hypothetical protein